MKTANAQGLSRLVTGKNPDGSAGVGVGVVLSDCKVDKAMTAKLPNMKDEDKVKWLG